MFALLRKINNLQVQIYINLKTDNRFKYKMDYSLVILSMWVQQSTRIKGGGLNTEDIFSEKCLQTWLFFGDKWPKIWLLVRENGTKKIWLAKMVAKEK